MRCAVAFLILGLLLASVPLRAQQFQSPVRLKTDSDPSFVYVVDLNRDGIPDIIWGDNSVVPNRVGTFLGQPGGGFRPGPTLQLPSNVGALHCEMADVNSDGYPDLLCLSEIDPYDANMATFFGNGDGSFQTPVYSAGEIQAILAYLNPIFFTPADLNGDGQSDVFVHSIVDGFTQILLGDGTGNFTDASTILDGPNYPYSYTALDLNGDGKVDLVASTGPQVWIGAGNGNFTGGVYSALDSGCTFHDMDGDGHPDAVCAAWDPTVGTSELAILHGNTDGSFNPNPIYLHKFGTTYETDGDFDNALKVADLNGDGISDILASSMDGLTVLIGKPGGLNFADPIHYAVGFVGIAGENSIAFADMNGDGHLDVVAACPNGICISYGNGDGTFQTVRSMKVAEALSHATVADFNGDGIPDIAATGDQNIELSLGNGDGTFQPYTLLSTPGINFLGKSGGAVQEPQIKHGDFRGNGKQDILAIGYSGPYTDAFYLFFGNGDGAFESPLQIQDVNLPFGGYWPFSVQDINGDGRDDIVTVDADNIYVALSNGDGTFTTMTTPMASQFVGRSPLPPVFADFRNDGKLDAVYFSATNTIVLKGHGDGTFDTTGLILPAPVIQGEDPGVVESIVTGDFDDDGNQDIAELVEMNGDWIPGGYPPINFGAFPVAAVLYYGNGDGTFSAPVVAGTFQQPYLRLTAADVNGDGRDDLILHTEQVQGFDDDVEGDAVGVVLSQPGRVFGPEDDYFAGTPLNDLVVTDLNRDGRLDLLGINGAFFENGDYLSDTGNGVTPLLNLGAATVNGAATATKLTSSNKTPAAGSQVTITATVSTSATGKPAPSGEVRFVDQTGLSEIATLTPVNATTATADFTTSNLGIGKDTIGATYSGDSNFAPSSALLTETVGGVASTVTATANPNPTLASAATDISGSVANPSGSSAPVPSGYVTMEVDGAPFAGPFSLSNGTFDTQQSFAPGINNITIAYSGDAVHTPSSTKLALDVLMVPDVTVSLSADPITVAQPETVTVEVTQPSGNTVPTGTVVLTGSGYTSPSATLANGAAAITIPAGALPVGNDWITATYTPDTASSTVFGSTTGTDEIEVNSLPPSFSLSGSAVSVAPGATTGNASTITVTPTGGFTGTVTLTAEFSSTPSGAVNLPTLSFGTTNPVSVSSNHPATATLTITTVGNTSSRLAEPQFPWGSIGGTAFAGLLVLVLPWRRSRQLRLLVLLLFLGVVTTGMLACSGGNGGGNGGGGGGSSVTTPGNYTITIIGASGSTSESTQLALTVQ